MFRSTLVAIAAALVLVGPPASAAPATPVGASPAGAAQRNAAGAITGTWKGQVRNQDGLAGYTGTVRLTRSGGTYHGRVSYSGGLSPTTWVDAGRAGGWFRFREISRSSTDDGVGGTEIKVKRMGATLLVRYHVRELDYRGSMKAHRLR